MKRDVPFKAVLPVGLAVLLLACGRQAEGERCDTANGDDDCESGLRCVSNTELSQIEEGALCCPPADQTPSVETCNADIPLFGEDDDSDDQRDAAEGTPDDGTADAG